MNIHRTNNRGARGTTSTVLIGSCLDLFEKADGFHEGVDCDTEVVPGLTLRLIIDTLIASEQQTISSKKFFGEQSD